jgi:squalene-associated FAD-dependent desaturase
MAAAVRAAERGAKVTVFEAARVLGGRARRVEYQGSILDNGQHILSGAYRECLKLMDLVGVPARHLKRVPLNLAIPPHFRLRAPLLPAPLHMAAALVGAQGLSIIDRLRAISLMQHLKSKAFLIEPDCTVDTLLAAQGQSPALISHLWQPLTVSALNTPVHSASAQVFANVLRDALAGAREASDLLLPTTDLTTLFPEPAAHWLAARGHRVATGIAVAGLQLEGEKITLTGPAHLAGQAYDAAILAVGPHQRAPLLASLPETSIRDAPHFSPEPIVTIYLAFAEDSPPLAEAMLGRATGVAQWFFDRKLIANAPSGLRIIAAVISASGAHEALDNDALVAQVSGELAVLSPAHHTPLWTKVIREKFATFSCTPNANRARPSMRTHLPRLYLAGDDVKNPERQYPATLEGAIRNGLAAADAALSDLHQP